MQHTNDSSLRSSSNIRLQDFALECIAALRPLVERIQRRDKSLADQLRRAASSAVLNLHEATHSDPGNGRARLFTASGSASEARAAIKLAVAWGYVEREAAVAVEAKLDRLCARLYGLARAR